MGPKIPNQTDFSFINGSPNSGPDVYATTTDFLEQPRFQDYSYCQTRRPRQTVQQCTVYSSVQCKILYTVQQYTVYSSVQCTVLYIVQQCTVNSSVQYIVVYSIQYCTVYTTVLCTEVYCHTHTYLHNLEGSSVQCSVPAAGPGLTTTHLCDPVYCKLFQRPLNPAAVHLYTLLLYTVQLYTLQLKTDFFLVFLTFVCCTFVYYTSVYCTFVYCTFVYCTFVHITFVLKLLYSYILYNSKGLSMYFQALTQFVASH